MMFESTSLYNFDKTLLAPEADVFGVGEAGGEADKDNAVRGDFCLPAVFALYSA